ncbi:MAG: serine phosphatase RsbU (regulator of sigma subunit) [Parvicellaceae bacterium]|jgi:serine phosphatase RsbU (regulator of sigma subunit)
MSSFFTFTLLVYFCKLKHIIWSVLIILIFSVEGRSQTSVGQLPIQNFPRKDYNSQAQNWQITQGDDQLIYIANNGGLLIYNGEDWKERALKGESPAKSLLYINDTIYVGGINELGFFKKDSIGIWIYHSLVHLIEAKHADFQSVWNIHKKNNHILFQCHNHIFDLYPDRKKIITTHSDVEIANAYLLDDHYFVALPTLGLCDLIENEINPLTGGPILKDNRINGMIKTSDGEGYLLFTSVNGIFEMRKNEDLGTYYFKAFGDDPSKFAGKEFHSAKRLPNGLISTIIVGVGVYFISDKGNVVNEITYATGLIDLNGACLYVDRQSNLWVGTSNGISRIEINSTTSKYDQLYGLTGTVESLTKYRDTLFAATHSGLFYLDKEANRFINSQTTKLECFGLDVIIIDRTEHLLVAVNDGVYNYHKGKLNKISLAYPWRFIQNPKNHREVLVGLDGGIGVLNYIDGEWSYRDTNTLIQGDVNNVTNFNDDLWLGTKQHGIYQLQSENLFNGIKNYGAEEGLPENSIVTSPYDGKLVLGTKDGLFYIENGNVVKSPLLEQINFENKNAARVHRLSTDKRGQLWIVAYNDNKSSFDIGFISKAGNDLIWNYSDFSTVSDEVIYSFYHDDNDITWLGGGSGVYKYQPIVESNAKLDFPVYITSIRHSDNKDSSIVTLDVGIYAPKEYSYQDHNLWFDFAAPSYFGDRDNEASQNEYSFYLEGKNEIWSDWKMTTNVEYQNLHEGEYVFHLKAKDFYGNISKELSYSFTVLPPWYRSMFAYIMYVVAFGFVLFIAVKLGIRRVKKQNERLEEIIVERTAEVVAQKEEIEEQKELVDEQNRDILDSIKYAERIQGAILPPQKSIRSTFKDSFVLFKPKDIVSGDFYWMEVIDDQVYFAAVDCTGHGVPGAMVSVVGNNGLNRCVKEFGLKNPAKILDKLTQLVEETFEKSEDQVRDGMDIGLCKVDIKTRTVEFAGANNPMWIISDNPKFAANYEALSTGMSLDETTLFEVKPDKQPIGNYEDRKPYTNHTVQLFENDRVYLFSDGYPDQFGGPKGKKFKYKPFKKLMLSTFGMKMSAQHNMLDSEFEKWRADYEQVDDVCIFGIEL